jgi:hypothetical protein
MSKRKKKNKISKTDKLAISALSFLGIVGGWNIIGNVENSTSAKTLEVDTAVTSTPPTVQPTIKPWPTIQPIAQIPRLEVNVLPTLAVKMSDKTGTYTSDQIAGGSPTSLDLPTVPNAVPMPTLAPLPTLPEYVPPPPPPPAQPSSNNGGGGGGNRSSGS